jgi:ABC-type sulfate transport system permease subunit
MSVGTVKRTESDVFGSLGPILCAGNSQMLFGCPEFAVVASFIPVNFPVATRVSLPLMK